jgi:hypothetical protein
MASNTSFPKLGFKDGLRVPGGRIILNVLNKSFRSSGKFEGNGNVGSFGAKGDPKPGIAGKLGPSGSVRLISSGEQGDIIYLYIIIMIVLEV